MIYGLLLLIFILILYIIMLHYKLHEIKELVQECNILSSKEDNKKQRKDLRFSVDKDFNIIKINDDMISYGNYKREDLLGKSILGNIIEDIPANKENLKDILKYLKKNKRTLSSEQMLYKTDGSKIPVILRASPILNELLQCKGISFLAYPLKQKLTLEKQLKTVKEKDALISNILNQKSLYKYLSDQIKVCNRYNRPLLFISIELSDILNFVDSGFSFNTGDKLLRSVADACIECVGNIAKIGRYDNTKIGIIITKYKKEKISEITQVIWDSIINKIRKLNVDKVNAEMVSIFYMQRRGINESAENMLSSSRMYLKNSTISHNYGIGSLDKFN